MSKNFCLIATLIVCANALTAHALQNNESSNQELSGWFDGLKLKKIIAVSGGSSTAGAVLSAGPAIVESMRGRAMLEKNLKTLQKKLRDYPSKIENLETRLKELKGRSQLRETLSMHLDDAQRSQSLDQTAKAEITSKIKALENGAGRRFAFAALRGAAIFGIASLAAQMVPHLPEEERALRAVSQGVGAGLAANLIWQAGRMLKGGFRTFSAQSLAMAAAGAFLASAVTAATGS